MLWFKSCKDAAEKSKGMIHTESITHTGPMGNVYFRPMILGTVGTVVAGHSHNYDHVTFLWKGSVKLRAWHKDQEKNGKINGDVVERTYKAPARVLIKKDMCHEFTALEDNTFADCIFALRDYSGEVTEEWNGNIHAVT
jgi:dTDP-4-dehydrorhamnose 3,5-epimerase-like enzyme